MDIKGRANGNFALVDLKVASREELLSIGWISKRDIDALLQYCGLRDNCLNCRWQGSCPWMRSDWTSWRDVASLQSG